MVAFATPGPLDHSGESQELSRLGGDLPMRLDRLMPGLRLLVVDPDPATAVLLRHALNATEATLPKRLPPGKPRLLTPPQADPPAEPRTALVFAAATLAEATHTLKRLMARGEPIHLILAEHTLPDGLGLQLAQWLGDGRCESRLIITSATPTLAASIDAFRQGALDYLPKPLDARTIAQRMRIAAGRRYLQLKDQRRLSRLKGAMRQLNSARHVVGQKVDLLCQDLVGAYSELARQLERVRVGGHLTKLLESAADLEQLLCHMMDWILRELGHCNIAIFLTDHEGKSELGAFMKHTIAGSDRITGWLAAHVIPRITADGFMHPGSTPLEPPLPEVKPMRQQTIVAVDCTYLAESLATLVAFRPGDKPFSGDDLTLLRAAGPVFATALTKLIRAGETQERKQSGDEDDWLRRSA